MMTRMAIGDGLPSMCKGAQGGMVGALRRKRKTIWFDTVPSCRV